jgi:hypothetical protein
MKRRIVLSALMLIITATLSLANKGGVINDKVLTSFKKEFAGAKEVNWETTSLFVKASFTWNEQVYTAYYNVDGDRLAIVRNLRSVDLPMSLREELKESYSNYWISDLFEIHGKEESAYYVTIEDADRKITLKSVGFNEWITFKKEDKK